MLVVIGCCSVDCRPWWPDEMHEREGPEFPRAGFSSANAEALSGSEVEHPRSTSEDAAIERDAAEADDPRLHRRDQHHGGDLWCDIRAPVVRTDDLTGPLRAYQQQPTSSSPGHAGWGCALEVAGNGPGVRRAPVQGTVASHGSAFTASVIVSVSEAMRARPAFRWSCSRQAPSTKTSFSCSLRFRTASGVKSL